MNRRYLEWNAVSENILLVVKLIIYFIYFSFGYKVLVLRIRKSSETFAKFCKTSKDLSIMFLEYFRKFSNFFGKIFIH